MRVIPRFDTTKAEWNALVAAAPQGWLFHTWDFLDALLTWQGQLDRSFAIINDSDSLVAIIPFMIKKETRSIMYPYTTASCLGGPIVRKLDDVHEVNSVQSLIEQNVQKIISCNHVQRTEISYLPDLEGIPASSSQLMPGAQTTTSVQWLADLSLTNEQMWNQASKGTKSAIKKAERSIDNLNRAQPNDINELYELHMNHCNRNKLVPHPREYLEIILTKVFEQDLGFCLTAVMQDKIVAALYIGTMKNRGFYWMGHTSEIGLRINANYVLQWRALDELRHRNCRFYLLGDQNLDSTMKKENRISHFKKKFATSSVEYRKQTWRRRSIINTLLKTKNMVLSYGT